MTTAPDGKYQPVIARKVDGGDHVGNVPGPDYERRVPVNHAVVDLTRLIIALVAGMKQRTAKMRCQLLDVGLLECDGGSFWFHALFPLCLCLFTSR